MAMNTAQEKNEKSDAGDVSRRGDGKTNGGSPTLRDVALAAGVSPYTVSVVLNGSRSNTRVSVATRRRIEESAQALRYHPNAMARGLARRRMNTLGVAVAVVKSSAALADAYASTILQGIVAEASARGYDVLLYTEEWKNAETSAARYRDRRADGVIVIAPLIGADMVSGLALENVPLAIVAPDQNALPSGVPAVDVDNARGVALAVEHLVGLGHTRIAHLTGDSDVPSVLQRKAAFLQEMEQSGLAVPPGYLVSCTYDARTVPAALRDLLALPEPPTAIVAGNDNIAIAVMEAARALGVAVPQALSVVGFDDISAAGQVTPKLTTVRQPLLEIGRVAAQFLIARIGEDFGEAASVPSLNEDRAGDAEGEKVRLLAPELITRSSTAPPLSVA